MYAVTQKRDARSLALKRVFVRCEHKRLGEHVAAGTHESGGRL